MGLDATTYDKGYSWFVLLASFGLFALYANNAVSHGILLPEFLDYFQVTKAEASLPSSLLFGVSGIIGIGTGCNLVGGTLGILHYFKKRRPLAFGIAGAGFSTGSLSSPQIIRFTISQFGWRGALLLQGAIQLNVIVCGALLRSQPEVEIELERGAGKRKTWREYMKDIFDFTLFQDAKFSVYLVACFLFASGHTVPYLYLPAKALKTGSNHFQSATLVTIMAVCSGIFRVFFGWIGGFLGIQRTLLHGLSLMTVGIFYIVSTYLFKYIYLAVYAALCGITSGMLVDLSGVYGTPFLVFGVVMVTAGACSFILYMLQKREQTYRAKESN